MRRGELFHAHTPSFFSRLPEAESHYSPYVLPLVSPSFFFAFLCSLARAVLLILRSSFRLLLSCTSARNLPRDHFRVNTDSTRVFPDDTVFLDISLRPTATTTTATATRKCGACFSPCQVLPHDDRTLSPRIYVAKHDSRELSTMKFGNGTIPS